MIRLFCLQPAQNFCVVNTPIPQLAFTSTRRSQVRTVFCFRALAVIRFTASNVRLKSDFLCGKQAAKNPAARRQAAQIKSLSYRSKPTAVMQNATIGAQSSRPHGLDSVITVNALMRTIMLICSPAAWMKTAMRSVKVSPMTTRMWTIIKIQPIPKMISVTIGIGLLSWIAAASSAWFIL